MAPVCSRAVIGLALVAVLLPSATRGARAQGLLERMQDEIAAIATKAKGAVVTIEDARRVTRLDVDMTSAAQDSAAREAERALQEEMKRLDRLNQENASQVTAERRAAALKQREAVQKQVVELRRRLLTIRQTVRESLRGFAPIVLAAGPKAGTGFCIGDGYVVTTADVLEGMRDPVVVSDTGVRVKAEVIGMDSDLNVGLVRTPKEADLAGLKWGDSSAVKVGHFAISIGNQSGQANSVSLALVAGIRGAGTYAGSRFYPGLIQIAGTVGAGTSGAPLLNARGEVIGMVAAVPVGEWTERPFPFGGLGGPQPAAPSPPGKDTGKPGAAIAPNDSPLNQPKILEFGRSGQDDQRSEVYRLKSDAAGSLAEAAKAAQAFTFVRPPVTSAGFAIPINDVRQAVEALRSGKPLERAWIGVSTGDETRYETLGVLQKPVTIVRVQAVFPESPARLGGIQPGDELVSLNGRPVDSSADVRAAALQLRPGESLEVKLRRGEGTRTLTLRIAARPGVIPRVEPPVAAPPAPPKPGDGGRRQE